MSFSSPIYGDYNGIFLIFIRVTLQDLWAPVSNHSGIFHFKKSAVFRTLQLLHTAPHKSCGRINARCECNVGRSGDLLSGLTRDYSKKLSSKETTLFDEENQAFFTADCGRLQVLFISPHSLSVNGSSGVAPGKTIRSRSIVLRHKVANTPYIMPMARTEYRYCGLFAVILGRTQNLHFAGDGWFMQRRSHIHKLPLLAFHEELSELARDAVVLSLV